MTHIAFDSLEFANRAGTLSMQGLLLLAITLLGTGMVWMHLDNRKLLFAMVKELKEREEAMTVERKARIEFLMKLIQDDTVAKTQVANALTGNSAAITDLKLFIKDHLSTHK